MNADDPSARIVRIASPMASPGQCGICGKSSHPDGFAHADLDFEFYGTLIFCRDCACSFAAVFGAATPEKAMSLAQTAIEQQDEINHLKILVGHLEASLENLTAVTAARTLHSSRFGTATPELPFDDEPHAAAPVALTVNSDEPAASVTGSADAVSEQGPDDVRDAVASADELLGL